MKTLLSHHIIILISTTSCRSHLIITIRAVLAGENLNRFERFNNMKYNNKPL